MVICVIRYFLELFSSNVPFVRFCFIFLLNIFLFSLQRSFWCRKCARSRFEITAFAYFTIVWERLPAQVWECMCVWMDSAYAHTFVSFALIFFVFLSVFILIFSPYFSDILQSPCYARVLVILIWFGCPSLVS